jgi:PAS domain S-box-containing protein
MPEKNAPGLLTPLTSRFKGYPAAVAALLVAAALHFVFLQVFGRSFAGIRFVYLLAILAAAWRGYGPGLLVTTAVVLLTYFLQPISNLSPGMVIAGYLVSLTVSRVSSMQARAQSALRKANQELDERVRRRTQELEHANLSLRERFAELEALYCELPVGVCFLDRELRYLRISESLAAENGASAAAHIGRDLREMMAPALADALSPLCRQVLETREPVANRELAAAGRHWRIGCSGVSSDGGAWMGVQLIVEDITTRKQQEGSLLLMSNIIESSEDAVVSKDLKGVISSWNPAAERIYGYAAAEVVGRSITVLLPPDRPHEEEEILEQLRRGVRVEHFETVRVRKDGKPIHVSLTISPIRDSSGQVIGASHVARDISERMLLEAQMRQTQKLESLGILAGGVAHDFNNLLTGVLGNASLALESTSPSSPNRAMLEEVVKAAERAAELTRQLLAYAGKGRFVTRLIDLSELVREATSLVQTSIPKNVHLRLDLAANLPLIEADVGQMQQIIMNLVINGAEAIGDVPGTVLVQIAVQPVDEQYAATISAAGIGLKPGQYVVLEVHDTGCGMDDATKARIFDPFFTTKFTGRGLGLSAVLGIVRGHRGALKVYSTPGKGSTFKVLLPAAEQNQSTPLDTTSAVTELGGEGLVLVADDEPIVRTTARLTLERFGYEVVLAENGKEAIEIFRRRAAEIRAVLLDLTMPLMSGEETLRHLKVIDPGVRVVLSSGFNEVEAVQRFTGKGLAGFIQKPYTAVALARKVKEALEDGA